MNRTAQCVTFFRHGISNVKKKQFFVVVKICLTSSSCLLLPNIAKQGNRLPTLSLGILFYVWRLEPVPILACREYTVKKGYRFSRPQPGCHKPNSPKPEIIKLFLSRESLVSDITAGDGETINHFLQCRQPKQTTAKKHGLL